MTSSQLSVGSNTIFANISSPSGLYIIDTLSTTAYSTPPIVVITPSSNLKRMQTESFVISAAGSSDPDSDPASNPILTYSWTCQTQGKMCQYANGSIIDTNSTSTLTFVPNSLVVGQYNFALTVRSATGLTPVSIYLNMIAYVQPANFIVTNTYTFCGGDLLQTVYTPILTCIMMGDGTYVNFGTLRGDVISELYFIYSWFYSKILARIRTRRLQSISCNKTVTFTQVAEKSQGLYVSVLIAPIALFKLFR